MFIPRQQLPSFQRMGTLICGFLVLFLLVVDTGTSSAQIYTRVVLSLHALQIQPLWALCHKKYCFPKQHCQKTVLLKV
ncbi:hypothetical protein EV363DRAFT_1435553 [Boletus edulis]|nr:hypothetical protein EV363DRAFT_1435553 [Boletus edulis]